MADYTLYCFGESGNAYKVALMLQAAEVGPADHVLLIGAEDSYAHSLLSRRAAKVHAAQTADGLPKDMFSVIFIDGAAEELPKELIAAAQEGGRIVTGLLERGAVGFREKQKVRG